MIWASLSIFIAYISYILIRYGMQRSISDSWYRLTTGGKWLFTIATWGYILPLSIAGAQKATDATYLLMVLATFMLCIVGVYPDFKTNYDKPWHVVGAEGGIFLALLWALIAGHWFVFAPIAVIVYLMVKQPKNNTFWIECIAYFTLFTAIYLN